MLQSKPGLNLSIGGQKIERVEAIKYLRVLLGDGLTFQHHVQYVIAKSTKKLGILRKSRDFLDRKTPILLYKSLVLPHIDYCDLTYITVTEYNLHQLQLVKCGVQDHSLSRQQNQYQKYAQRTKTLGPQRQTIPSSIHGMLQTGQY